MPPFLGQRIYLGDSSAENIGALSTLKLAQGAGFPCWKRQAKETWGYSQITPHPSIQFLKQVCHLPPKSIIVLTPPLPPSTGLPERQEERDKWEEPSRGQNTTERKFQTIPSKESYFDLIICQKFMNQRHC